MTTINTINTINTITGDTRLGDLVTARPHLAARLDRLGLDYCCGGQRSIAAAVDDARLDLAAVLAELDEHTPLDRASRPDWADLGPAELVDHLESTHHAYLDAALPRLVALAVKVADVHGDRHPELRDVQRLVIDLRDDLEPHLRKEEQVLFPMIRELASATAAPGFHCGTLRNPISVMLREHDQAGELLARLRTVANEYRTPDDGCASYRALYDGLVELEVDTHLHVHKENNLLFPQVLAAEDALATGP